jgi:dsRNA-specific ribonuclease
MVADSFEALLGVIYMRHGIEKCRDFLWKIGLLRRFENEVNFCDYRDLVSTDIEKSLKYTFSNKSLLIAALGKAMSSKEDYCLFRRLECLGDAALEFISTVFLFKSDTTCSVGVLNDQRQNLICNRNFSQLSCKYGLTDSLSKFGSDVWESVCGAILIDLSFNIEDFKEIILPHIVLSFTQNPKSSVQQLNEISQTDLFRDSDFDYRFSQNSETNYFSCHVWIDNLCIASGIGKCKSEAKRNACEAALSCFSIGSSF